MWVPACSAVGSHTSVPTRSCWCNNKVVQYIWTCKTVLQWYRISFCLTPPTVALYLSSPVMFLLLFESHFVTWSLLVVFHLQLPPAFFILVLSHYSLPSGYFFPSYYSSLYMQGWNLQLFLLHVIHKSGAQQVPMSQACVLDTFIVPFSVLLSHSGKFFGN